MDRNSKLTSLFGMSSIETSAGMPFRRRTSDFTWKTKAGNKTGDVDWRGGSHKIQYTIFKQPRKS